MLETAVVAARLAGQRAMEEINFTKVSLKHGTEPVTQADIHCQKIIIDRIKETYPDHGFIAEEGIDNNIFKQSPRGSKPVWWVIDPIDGTANYAHGMMLFTVSIAAMYQGMPIVAAVFQPAAEMMFTAVKNGEPQLNARRINASDDPFNKLSSVGIDSHYDDGVPGWICEIMQKTRFRNLGTTALHLAYVARGSLIAAIANRPRLWDIAAAAFIAEAAGAVVTDWKGQKIFPIDMDAYTDSAIEIIAANKKVHAEMLNLIK